MTCSHDGKALPVDVHNARIEGTESDDDLVALQVNGERVARPLFNEDVRPEGVRMGPRN